MQDWKTGVLGFSVITSSCTSIPYLPRRLLRKTLATLDDRAQNDIYLLSTFGRVSCFYNSNSDCDLSNPTSDRNSGFHPVYGEWTLCVSLLVVTVQVLSASWAGGPVGQMYECFSNEPPPHLPIHLSFNQKLFGRVLSCKTIEYRTVVQFLY